MVGVAETAFSECSAKGQAPGRIVQVHYELLHRPQEACAKENNNNDNNNHCISRAPFHVKYAQLR